MYTLVIGKTIKFLLTCQKIIVFFVVILTKELRCHVLSSLHAEYSTEKHNFPTVRSPTIFQKKISSSFGGMSPMKPLPYAPDRH